MIHNQRIIDAINENNDKDNTRTNGKQTDQKNHDSNKSDNVNARNIKLPYFFVIYCNIVDYTNDVVAMKAFG